MGGRFGDHSGMKAMSGWYRFVYFVAMSFTLSVTGALTENAEKAVHTISTFPLGIADQSTELAFLSTSEGIQALKLGDGGSMWIYPHGGIPLFAESGTLTVLAIGSNGDGLAVVFLNCADGKPISRPQPFRVSSVDARALLQLDQPPSVEVHTREIYFNWLRQGIYKGGANPPVSMISPSSGQYIARAKISLVSGESEFMGAQPLSEAIGKGKDEEILYEKGADLKYGPWSTPSGVQADLVEESVSRETMVVLKVKNQDSRSTSVTLGRAGNKPPYVTADGQYILLFAEGKMQDQNKALLFSVSTASLVRAIDGISTLSGTSVIGPRIYYKGIPANSTVEVNAADLTNGKILWRRIFDARKPPAQQVSP